MGIFGKSDPVADAAAEVEQLQRRERKMLARVTDVERELATARMRVRTALISGDDDAEDAPVLSDDVAAIEARLISLRDAAGELTDRRRVAERALMEARATVERAKLADLMATTNAELQRDLTAFERAASGLVTTLQKLSIGGQPIGARYRPFVEGMIGEIRQIVAGEEQRQARVAAGEAPVPAIAVLTPIVPPPAIARQSMFALKQLCWTDDAGAVKTCIRHAVVDLPVAAAQRALALGVVLQADDARVRTTVDSWGNVGIRTHGAALIRLPIDECINVDPPGDAPEEAAA